MDYSVTHFKIEVQADLMQTCRELLADSVCEAGYESFVDTEDGIDGYIQTQYYSEEHTLGQILDFPIETAAISFHTEEVESQNWNEVYEKEVFEPIRVGHECIIYDAASPDAATLAAEAPVAIAIDQQMAFGNGAHETTKMIVEKLLGLDLAGKRVLDCGCGTGILSIVAKRCGAENVTAYDIDEWSVDNTRHNAELNKVVIDEILLGDVSVLSHVDGMFDVIVANINRNILLADLPEIVETLNAGGTVILSGFYDDDAQMLVDKAAELGLHETGRNVTNAWTMLVFER